MSKIEGIDNTIVRELFGELDENARYLEKRYEVMINTLSGDLTIEGAAEESVAKIIEIMIEKVRGGEKIRPREVRFIADMVDDGTQDRREDLNKTLYTTVRGKQIRPKTYGQALYAKSIFDNEVVFGVGPAGTGKTYLAVCLAVRAFKDRIVDKIILTRPAVEAGEKLGFLPGDLGAKVDPYLRPLYDALQEMFGTETYQRLIEKGLIEIAPLAYMRGRTLSNAFIILDEAQNTTKEQMKMFLTRMGDGSKIVVTGDITQIDLPNKRASGLLDAIKVLDGVEGIDIIYLTGKDVVRHELVMRIVNAYEKLEDEYDLAQKNREIDAQIADKSGENCGSKEE